MNSTDEFLIDAFKQQGLITDDIISEVEEGLSAQADGQLTDQDQMLMEALLSRIGLPHQDVVDFLAAELNMEAVDMSQIDPPAEIISLLQATWARQYEAFPIAASTTEVEIVFGNPLDEDGIGKPDTSTGQSHLPENCLPRRCA